MPDTLPIRFETTVSLEVPPVLYDVLKRNSDLLGVNIPDFVVASLCTFINTQMWRFVTPEEKEKLRELNDKLLEVANV